MLKGAFTPYRFLDLIRSFTVFEVDGNKINKKMAAYHQFHPVNKAVDETAEASGPEGDRIVGIVWHTQGSGKSHSMVFYAGKVIHQPDMENPTLIILTDRNDLDHQLFGTFAGGQELLRQKPVQAESREHLQQLLQVASGGVVFTTIQKFRPEGRDSEYPLLSERRNIIFIAMATEIELKLYCAPDEIDRVGMHPLIGRWRRNRPGEATGEHVLHTPDLALHQERIAVRVRKTPTELLQTVKCAAKSVAGLSARPEWETPYAGAFDFSAVDARKVRAFLAERQSSLVPVFTTSFERRTWRIDVSRKIALWVMVDTGYVSSGDREFPISEVELELAEGNPEDLLDFASALATHLPLVPHEWPSRYLSRY